MREKGFSFGDRHAEVGDVMDAQELEERLVDFDLRAQRSGSGFAEEWARDRWPDEGGAVIAAYWDRIGELSHGKGLVASDHPAWYLPKPDYESPRWAHAKAMLDLSPKIVAETSRVADEILARLGNPRGEAITTRGLVLGYVQSGKTTSFLSVAAKAADNGYDLIIVLAGVHNSLRRQTQDRAARTLIHNPSLWWIGTAVADFKPDGNSLSSHLAGNGKRGLLVVKKHPTILERLADWLEAESDSTLRQLAVLVIDDEADQAGLDVSTGNGLEGVHKQLSRVVNLKTSDGQRRCAYLAYTATPYANILTSQDDYGLYPRDFIYPLERPADYFGSQQMFGNDQVGQPIELEQDSTGVLLTDGLRDALRWFVLATAARAGLGDSLETFHSSMLIHTTQKTEEQIAFQPVVEGYLRQLAEEFDADESSMALFYREVLDRVPARAAGGEGVIDEETADWDRVRLHVAEVLTRLIERKPSGEPFKEDGHAQHAHSGVIVDNSKVDWTDRLTYSNLSAGQPSVTVIAIGGNTLSRGADARRFDMQLLRQDGTDIRLTDADGALVRISPRLPAPRTRVDDAAAPRLVPRIERGRRGAPPRTRMDAGEGARAGPVRTSYSGVAEHEHHSARRDSFGDQAHLVFRHTHRPGLARSRRSSPRRERATGTSARGERR